MAPCSQAQSQLRSEGLGPGLQAPESWCYKQLIECSKVISGRNTEAVADGRLQGLSEIQEVDVRKVSENGGEQAETPKMKARMK